MHQILSDVFEKNLKILSRYHPLNLDLLKSHEDAFVPVETFEPLNFEDYAGYQGLLVFGLGEGKFIEYLLTWLDLNPERRLVVCESNPGTYRVFLKTEKAQALLEKKRLHFILAPDGIKENHIHYLRDIVQQMIKLLNLYSCGFIEHPQYKDSTGARQKNYLEAIYQGLSHFYSANDFLRGNQYKMCTNIMENLSVNKEFILLEHLKDHFKNVPIVLCAAGISLPKVYDKLKEIQSHTLIASAGTGSAMLAKHGIESHFSAIMDISPNQVLAPQYHTHSGALFFLPRSGCHAVALHQGIKILSRSEQPYPLFNHFFVSEVEAFTAYNFNTVSDFLLQQLLYLGFGPIYLCGLDHVMSHDQYYGENMLQEKTNNCDKRMFIKTRNHLGKEVLTKFDWIQGSKALGDLAKKYPETEIFYVTDEGLPIENMKILSTDDFNQLPFQKQATAEDQFLPILLSKPLHQMQDRIMLEQINTLKDSITKIQEILKKTEVELGRLFSTWQVTPIDALNPYTDIFFYLQTELEQEMVYKKFLSPMWNTFKHQLHTESGFLEDPEKIKITLFGLKVRELDFYKQNVDLLLKMLILQGKQLSARRKKFETNSQASSDKTLDSNTNLSSDPCLV